MIRGGTPQNINPRNRLSSPNHGKLDPRKLPTVRYHKALASSPNVFVLRAATKVLFYCEMESGIVLNQTIGLWQAAQLVHFDWTTFALSVIYVVDKL